MLWSGSVLWLYAPVVKRFDARDVCGIHAYDQMGHWHVNLNYVDDFLKVIDKVGRLVGTLSRARSIEPEESLEKRVCLIYRIKKLLLITLWIGLTISLKSPLETNQETYFAYSTARLTITTGFWLRSTACKFVRNINYAHSRLEKSFEKRIYWVFNFVEPAIMFSSSRLYLVTLL